MQAPQPNQPEKPQSVTVSLLKFGGLMAACIVLAWLASFVLNLLY